MDRSIGLKSNKDKYRIFTAQNISFPDHIHRTYEVMVTKKGNILTKIDGVDYVLRENECAVILPLQHHSFSVGENDAVRIYLFSADYIPEFDKSVRGLLPECPVFALDAKFFTFQWQKTALSERTFFYTLCSMIMDRVTFLPSQSPLSRSSVVEKILLYINENYMDDCTLRAVAENLRYEYSYLSKVFHEATGYNFNEYLNHYRIGRACNQLIDTADSITTVASAVGYLSIRTFNREFVKIMGITPSQYRIIYSDKNGKL